VAGISDQHQPAFSSLSSAFLWEGCVFPEPPDYRYNPEVSFRKHAVGCGVPWLTYHDLRHSFGAHLLQRGAKIADVADLLGDDVIVTERHYAGLMRAQRGVVALL
jgi:integrase